MPRCLRDMCKEEAADDREAGLGSVRIVTAAGNQVVRREG